MKNIKNIVVYGIKIIKRYFDYLAMKRLRCEIKEFNLALKEVVICMYGIRVVAIKASIADIIGDAHVINNLPPYQACWLGYYYGKFWAKSPLNSGSVQRNAFVLRSVTGRFNIFSYDRNKILTYIDSSLNNSYKASPLTLAQDCSVISQFDSSQACYIGMLAGLIVAKEGEKVIPMHKKPILTVVK